MKSLKEFDFNQKTVLLRCDFNVSLNKQKTIADDFRIESSMETINHLLKDGARVVIITHLSNNDALPLVQKKLEEKLNLKICLIKNYPGIKAQDEIKATSFGDVVLLDNIRKYKEEENNDENFAKELSMLGDVYVNDAFSICHRKHASVVGIPKFLPSFAGYQLLKEIRILSKAKKDPWRPLVVIIGGAKVESKIKTLSSFLKIADHVILGGKLVNEILIIKGISNKKSTLNIETQKNVSQVELTSSRLHIPIDVLVSPSSKGNFYVRITGPGLIRSNEDIYDIGPESIKIYTEIIKSAKMIIWAGPLGLYEEKKFRNGTEEIARAIAMNHEAFKIIGGGDTGSVLNEFKIRDFIDHVSTGGGAMLSFFSEDELPGIKALKDSVDNK